MTLVSTRTACALATALLLGGCAGGPSSSSTGQLPVTAQSAHHHYVAQLDLRGFAGLNRALMPKHVSPLPIGVKPPGAPSYIVTCEFDGGDCREFSGAGSPVSSLTDLQNPQGVSIDPVYGVAYIANTNASDILAYSVSSGTFSYINTFLDSGYLPGDVQVRIVRISKENYAHILISNVYAASESGPGNLVYINQALQSSTMTAPGGYNAQGIGATFDKSGKNCFWSNNNEDAGGGVVDYYPNCTNPGKQIVGGLGFVGGLAIDKSDNLWVVDQVGGISRCKKTGGKSCTKIFPASDFVDPLFINFSADFSTLYVADYGAAAVDACSVTAGTCTTAAVTSPSDPDSGVAVWPAANP